jgi:hypothetical protein
VTCSCRSDGAPEEIRTPNLLIRSRKQHPLRTCNLSIDVPNPWVHVQGCPWSSVAVDVPTDVDREGLRWRTVAGGLPAAKHLILGQVFHDQAPQRGSGITGLARWRLVWNPVGLAQSDHAADQGQPSTEPVHASCGYAPGLPCGSPQGGRRDATPCPPRTSRSDSCARLSRRPASV